jgi:perosamine synthetase
MPINTPLNTALAIEGGPPALPDGPPPWPPADEAVRAALLSAYADGSWGLYHGPHSEQLSARLAELHKVEHVKMCSSGTIGVELALRGLGMKPGDEVVLAAYDFGGNWRAIEAIGARPVLVDIDPRTWCLDATQLEAALSEKTTAVIVSHLHGGLAEMPAISEIAARRGLAVVEDACQCPGAIVCGRPAGTWGDVGVWSFGGSKLLSAGRGGAVFTARADVAQRIKIFCERGNDAFPLSELQAAVLLPQLEKLAERNTRRSENACRLISSAGQVAGLRPVWNALAESEPAYYKLAFLYSAVEFGNRPREDFVAAARAEGIALDGGFRGFAARPESVCRKPGHLPNSRAAAENTLVLHHPVLLEEAAVVDRVAQGLRKVAAAFV